METIESLETKLQILKFFKSIFKDDFALINEGAELYSVKSRRFSIFLTITDAEELVKVKATDTANG